MRIKVNIIRQNADYALRAMAFLANQYEKGVVSTRVISEECDVSYQFACKIMQRLHSAELVNSTMGPRGGFMLRRDPAKISLLEVIESLQGPLIVNTCMRGPKACKRRETCNVSDKVTELQKSLIKSLDEIKLSEVMD